MSKVELDRDKKVIRLPSGAEIPFTHYTGYQPWAHGIVADYLDELRKPYLRGGIIFRGREFSWKKINKTLRKWGGKIAALDTPPHKRARLIDKYDELKDEALYVEEMLEKDRQDVGIKGGWQWVVIAQKLLKTKEVDPGDVDAIHKWLVTNLDPAKAPKEVWVICEQCQTGYVNLSALDKRVHSITQPHVCVNCSV